MMGWLDRLRGKRPPLPDLEAHGFAPLRRFTTRVSGVSFDNPDGTSRQRILQKLRPGDMTGLIRMPDHPDDPNAIAVVFRDRGMLGFIPAHISERLADQLDSGLVGFARVVEITGGTADKPTLGCAVEVLLYDDDMEIPDDLIE